MEQVNITLTHVSEIYENLSFFNHTKRDLTDGLGQLSRMLYGTAMKEDIQNRYNNLTPFALGQQKIFYLSSKPVEKPEWNVEYTVNISIL